MGDLLKYKIVKNFWYEGRHYEQGEELFLPLVLVDKIGAEHFEIIKALDVPNCDKMIHSPKLYK